MKITLEPDRSVMPDKYHKTPEHSFEVLDSCLTQLKDTIETCVAQINPMPQGMCGVTLETRKQTENFFVSVNENGHLNDW